jgi:hypothetical protein
METHEEGADVGDLGASITRQPAFSASPLGWAGRLTHVLRARQGIERGHHNQSTLAALMATLDVDAHEPPHHLCGGFWGPGGGTHCAKSWRQAASLGARQRLPNTP